MVFSCSDCPTVVIERTAARSMNDVPALPYRGEYWKAAVTMVPPPPPPPPPVPTGNCTSSPIASPLAFCICSLTIPSVSVSTFMPTGICLYAPPAESASSLSSSGSSVVSTSEPPPKSFQSPTSPKSVICPWNCFVSIVFSPVR